MTQGCLDLALEVDGLQVNRAKAALGGDQQVVAVAVEGGGQPITLRIVAHQRGGAGIGGDDLVTGDQHIGNARRPLRFTAVPPFHARLPDQPIDDVEYRVEDFGQISQQVGHPHHMVKIGARVPFRLARHQPKEILRAEGDAHKEMIFELGDRDKFIDINGVRRQQILVKHQPTTGHADRFIGRLRTIGKAHAKVAEDLGKGQRLLDFGHARQHIPADIAADQFGVRAFTQQAQKGACHSFADQLLQMAGVIKAVLWLFILVKFKTDAFGLAHSLPRCGQRRGGLFQCFVNFGFTGTVVTMNGAHFGADWVGDHNGSTQAVSKLKWLFGISCG